jgi:hypothetical protein
MTARNVKIRTANLPQLTFRITRSRGRRFGELSVGRRRRVAVTHKIRFPLTGLGQLVPWKRKLSRREQLVFMEVVARSVDSE